MCTLAAIVINFTSLDQMVSSPEVKTVPRIAIRISNFAVIVRAAIDKFIERSVYLNSASYTAYGAVGAIHVFNLEVYKTNMMSGWMRAVGKTYGDA